MAQQTDRRNSCSWRVIYFMCQNRLLCNDFETLTPSELYFLCEQPYCNEVHLVCLDVLHFIDDLQEESNTMR